MGQLVVLELLQAGKNLGDVHTLTLPPHTDGEALHAIGKRRTNDWRGRATHSLTAVGFLWRMQSVEPHLTMHHSESRNLSRGRGFRTSGPSKIFSGHVGIPFAVGIF